MSRACPRCGRVLLEAVDVPDGTFVACVHDGHLYQVHGERLVRAFAGLVEPAVRELFEASMEAFWRGQIEALTPAASAA